MQRIKIGTRAESLGINRLNCADGVKCRFVLLDPNPQYKSCAYDEKVKRIIEVDQDAVIKYGLRPFNSYYYLVAKLNTDQMGNIVGDQFVIEYVQLSETLNNELSDAILEFGNSYTSFQVTKVTKKGNNGQDFSYLRVIPSNMPISQEILSKIAAITSNSASIASMWKIIDFETSISVQQYEKILREQSGAPAIENTDRRANTYIGHTNTPTAAAHQVASVAKPAVIQQPGTQEPNMYPSDKEASDDFGVEDDFDPNDEFK